MQLGIELQLKKQCHRVSYSSKFCSADLDSFLPRRSSSYLPAQTSLLNVIHNPTKVLSFDFWWIQHVPVLWASYCVPFAFVLIQLAVHSRAPFLYMLSLYRNLPDFSAAFNLPMCPNTAWFPSCVFCSFSVSKCLISLPLRPSRDIAKCKVVRLLAAILFHDRPWRHAPYWTLSFRFALRVLLSPTHVSLPVRFWLWFATGSSMRPIVFLTAAVLIVFSSQVRFR